MAKTTLDPSDHGPQPDPLIDPELCFSEAVPGGDRPLPEPPPLYQELSDLEREVRLADRARKAEVEALIQLGWPLLSGRVASPEVTLGDLVGLTFLTRKSEAPTPSLVRDALLAAADDAEILSTQMEAIHRADDSVLARFAERMQSRALLALELDRRLRAANPGKAEYTGRARHG